MKAKDKGKLLEDITALMHAHDSVVADKRIKLPVTTSGTKSKRKREIDVLLTTHVVGYPVRMAIECKNQKKPVGAPQIDSFIGKLEDVGIPCQHGIFVSTSGYTLDAKGRAEHARIRLLDADGLTSDKLELLIHDAIACVAYIVPVIIGFAVSSDFENVNNIAEQLVLYDRDSNAEICLLDLAWEAWLKGYPSSELGISNIKIESGKKLIQRCGLDESPVNSAIVKIQTIALTYRQKGKATKTTLKNVLSNALEKMRISSFFPSRRGRIELTLVEDEGKLTKLSKCESGLSIVNRIRVPRLVCGPIYWPPTQETMEKAKEIVDKQIETGIFAQPSFLIWKVVIF